ncbi:Fic family protein [Microbacterium sp. ET2]|uniref:Fic family protein n=1 Tax=Microbacterium albipurpureum TaxID=3050384 RepID=UPI00259CED53|nr:Fic family protein [Microbacterium sp. ET2 (Ac-2212)]WJL94320.1 Fic family protein [Microbacterium sp. ET2 (Ac-2212)]
MVTELATSDWPPHGAEVVPWRQERRGGSREDRVLTEVTTSMPPLIAELDYAIPADLTALSERALVVLGAMDGEATGQPAAMARFMIRSESVASSKIERISASTEDFARALAGQRSNSSALSMVAASTALATMVTSAGSRGTIDKADILAAHEALMRDDLAEGPYAGTLRDSQNWIGGSDNSPRNALFVPPPQGRVDELLDDLIVFANRDDLPTMAQVTIAHAQFESIHPFGDGNGRTGRALIGAILRRRGVTPQTVVPVASGLLARRGDYFDGLGSYRAGHVRPLLELMLRSAVAAAEEGRISVQRIKQFPQQWEAQLDVRRGSTAALLIPAFFDNPVMSVADIERVVGPVSQKLYNAIARLEDAGIVQEMTGRKRDRVWAAVDLMAELEDLDGRIAAAMETI